MSSTQLAESTRSEIAGAGEQRDDNADVIELVHDDDDDDDDKVDDAKTKRKALTTSVPLGGGVSLE